MLEGVAGIDRPENVAADEAVDAGKRDEIDVRPDGIERIELDAAQRPQQLAGIAMDDLPEPELAKEIGAGFVA
jgi:hypothetical protein